MFRPALLAVLLVYASAVALAQPQNVAASLGVQPIARAEYAGDRTCEGCHRTQAQSFRKTAHFLTSTRVDAGALAARFTQARTVLKTGNSGVSFVLDSRPGGYFQTATVDTAPKPRVTTERFDIATGSGRKGQTYLYWENDALHQLPISHWTVPGRWINSPGYRDGTADFSRPITPRCLECHATFARLVTTPNRYARNDMILGITCEKCHGPGRDHVAHRRAPGPSGPDPIVNPRRLVRERQVELCESCHAGTALASRTPPFTYRPGQVLTTYFTRPPVDRNPSVEVHANQVALLARSECFQASQMTCSTCHDVHSTQRDVTALAARCLTCHRADAHKRLPKAPANLRTGCVDCHMPNLTSQAIALTVLGGTERLQPQVRTHWIKVY